MSIARELTSTAPVSASAMEAFLSKARAKSKTVRGIGMAATYAQLTELLVRRYGLPFSLALATPSPIVPPQPQLNGDQLLSPEQLGDLLGVAPKTLANLRSKGGHIPFIRVGGRIKYRYSDVMAYLEKARATSTSDKGGHHA